jgi:hypothetical protein
VVWPPPRTTVEFFEVLVSDPVHGLLSLDVLSI